PQSKSSKSIKAPHVSSTTKKAVDDDKQPQADAVDDTEIEQEDKITKSDLEGPTFKLLKGKYKNYIKLEYNFEECYRALTDHIDWTNPVGERVPYDLSKPLPLHGPLGRTTIPVDFFNKDLEYLKNGSIERT
ncbi:hypothetical protein Tco_0198115, partial [Tanacetum coccineum]